MTTNCELQLRTWSTAGAMAVDVPLPASCTVELRCLPGADAVHIVLSDAGNVIVRAEVGPANAGEVVSFRLDADGQREPHIWSDAFRLFFLPPDSRYDPPPPISPTPADAPLDVAIVIDGTIRNWSTTAARLRDDETLWSAHAAKLVAFTEKLAGGRDSRVAVIAFGDQNPPSVTAADLRPKYDLEPRNEQLHESGLGRLHKKLMAVTSTPGGDFVDALADALYVCTRLRWRRGRRLLVVSGDSPGFSLLQPLTAGTDVCVRKRDVETQVLELHRMGVEIATIYHAAPSDAAVTLFGRSLLAQAGAQYSRIASLSEEMAFEASSFEPEEAANGVASIGVPIGRGASLGEFVRVRETATVAGAL